MAQKLVPAATADGKTVMVDPTTNQVVGGPVQDPLPGTHIGPPSTGNTLSDLQALKSIGGSEATPIMGMMGGSMLADLVPEIGLPIMGIRALLAGLGGAGGEEARASIAGNQAHPFAQGAVGVGAELLSPLIGKAADSVTAPIGKAIHGAMTKGGIGPDAIASGVRGLAYKLFGFPGYIVSHPLGAAIMRVLGKSAVKDAVEAAADGTPEAWDLAAKKILKARVGGKGSVYQMGPDAAQKIVEQVIGPRPEGGGIASVVKDMTAGSNRIPRPMMPSGPPTGYTPQFKPSAEELAAGQDPESAAGLSGPQTIRGITSKLRAPQGFNPEDITTKIQEALHPSSSAGPTGYDPSTDKDIQSLIGKLDDKLAGKNVKLRKIGMPGETIDQSEGLTPTELKLWAQYKASHNLSNNNSLDVFIQHVRKFGRAPK